MKLSKNERKILDYCSHHDISKMGIGEIAKANDTVASAISKLSRKLGYESFFEFKSNISETLNPEDVMSMGEFSSNYLNSVLKSVSSVEPSCIDKLCNEIVRADDIVLFGIGTSYLASKYFSTNLIRLGIRNYIDDDYFTTRRFISLSNKAVVIIFSHSSLTKEALKVVNKIDNQVIVITSNANTELSARADFLVPYKDVNVSRSNFSNVSMNIQIFLADLILNNLASKVDKGTKFNSPV